MLYIIICSFFGMWLVGCAIFFGPCLLKKKYQIKESAIGLKRNVAVKYKFKKRIRQIFLFMYSSSIWVQVYWFQLLIWSNMIKFLLFYLSSNFNQWLN